MQTVGPGCRLMPVFVAFFGGVPMIYRLQLIQTTGLTLLKFSVCFRNFLISNA